MTTNTLKPTLVVSKKQTSVGMAITAGPMYMISMFAENAERKKNCIDIRNKLFEISNIFHIYEIYRLFCLDSLNLFFFMLAGGS